MKRSKIPRLFRIEPGTRFRCEELIVRVHPELLERQRLPPGKRGWAFGEECYENINPFESLLARNGTLILKFFLN